MELSVQEIADCIPDVGCNGGMADPALIYDFVNKNGLCSAIRLTDPIAYRLFMRASSSLLTAGYDVVLHTAIRT